MELKLTTVDTEELRAQANQHPLDADLGMFDVAASRIERLEQELISVREVLSAQEDKSCLGTGYPSDSDTCAPWPIVDEIVSGITRTLTGV